VSSWASAVSAVVGGLIGMVGTLLGARLQFKEAARVRAEQHEHEDTYRLHRDRMDAYVEFYLAFGSLRKAATGNVDEAALMDARNEIWAWYTCILLLGERQVLDITKEILAFATEVAYDSDKYDDEALRVLSMRFQEVARRDLVGTAG
jgi:hypothetical protein